MSIFDKSNLYR